MTSCKDQSVIYYTDQAITNTFSHLITFASLHLFFAAEGLTQALHLSVKLPVNVLWLSWLGVPLQFFWIQRRDDTLALYQTQPVVSFPPLGSFPPPPTHALSHLLDLLCQFEHQMVRPFSKCTEEALPCFGERGGPRSRQR